MIKIKSFVYSYGTLKSLYDENTEVYSDYTEIMHNSGYIYLAACSNDSEYKISTEDLKSMIKSL